MVSRVGILCRCFVQLSMFAASTSSNKSILLQFQFVQQINCNCRLNIGPFMCQISRLCPKKFTQCLPSSSQITAQSMQKYSRPMHFELLTTSIAHRKLKENKKQTKPKHSWQIVYRAFVCFSIEIELNKFHLI